MLRITHASRARVARVLAVGAASVTALAVTAGVVAVAAEQDQPETATQPASQSVVAQRPVSPVVPGQRLTSLPTPSPTPEQAASREDGGSGGLSDIARRAEDQARRQDRRPDRSTPAPERVEAAPYTVKVGSFNVLGSQHTGPGGDRKGFPAASVRNVAAARYIAEHGVEVLGTQELQDDQLRALQSRTGMAAYPGFQWGTAETDNSILYDAGRFELVSGERFVIPFMGRPRPQPIVRLRDRATGREFYVVNTHPSAHDGRYLVERRKGQAALVAVVNRLKESGLPVLVTGDMNDREEFYCRVVPPAGLVAANGGSYGNGCTPPPGPIPVDWVVGHGVSFSDYWRDTRPVSAKMSDHFFISALASVA